MARAITVKLVNVFGGGEGGQGRLTVPRRIAAGMDVTLRYLFIDEGANPPAPFDPSSGSPSATLYAPDGTTTVSGTASKVSSGLYDFLFTLPSYSAALLGAWFASASVSDGTGTSSAPRAWVLEFTQN